MSNTLAPNGMVNVEKFENGFAEAIGLGGGVNPVGYPFAQGVPGSAMVENVGTIFRNLRWYLISNMHQVLNQAYVELGLVQTICDVPVDDALRGGVKIKSKQLDEEQLIELESSLDRDNDLNTAGQAGKWNRLFGGAGIMIINDEDPETPFDLNLVEEGDKLEFRACDMWELFYDSQSTDGYNPTTQTQVSEYYSYYGEKVHKSRVMKLEGLTAPSFIRPRLRGWGFSVVEILVRSINQYLKGTDLAFEVLDEFKVDVYKVKGLVTALMSPKGEEAIKKRVALANMQKNYQNAITMDSEDEWDHKQLSFSGLGEAMMQIRMQVAADMRMPLTKLFGVSAAGFNSGEDDIEVYNAMVESQVRNKLKHVIIRMIEIKCQILFGFIPDDLSVTFAPLRVMSSEQEETCKTQQFSRLLQAFTANVITLEEFRDGINKGELFDITLEAGAADMLTGYDADEVTDEDGETDDDPDDPASERVDTKPKRAAGRGDKPRGEPKKPKDAATKDKPARDAKEKKPQVKNQLVIMPRPWTRGERVLRSVSNSATFDRKAYEADGGDLWIEPRRALFFDRDKAQDKGLWSRGEHASRKALGEVRWQFVVWFYKKHGGSFSQIQNAEWDESKHPRADDGKFGTGGGGGGKRKKKESAYTDPKHGAADFGKPIDPGQVRLGHYIRERSGSFYVDVQAAKDVNPPDIEAPEGYKVESIKKGFSAPTGDYYLMKMSKEGGEPAPSGGEKPAGAGEKKPKKAKPLFDVRESGEIKMRRPETIEEATELLKTASEHFDKVRETAGDPKHDLVVLHAAQQFRRAKRWAEEALKMATAVKGA